MIMTREMEVNFDEALERLGFGKFNYIVTVLSGIIVLTSSIESYGVSFIFPVAECDLQLTTHDKSLLSIVSSTGMFT
jgi:VNT family MFS transporter (synaptic vesicle glycoprotein 2)